MMLEDAVESNFHRKMVQSNILNSMASFCPAFGMIGTLVGLVIMFEKWNGYIGDWKRNGTGIINNALRGFINPIIFKPASKKLGNVRNLSLSQLINYGRNIHDCRW